MNKIVEESIVLVMRARGISIQLATSLTMVPNPFLTPISLQPTSIPTTTSSTSKVAKIIQDNILDVIIKDIKNLKAKMSKLKKGQRAGLSYV
jgi:hypothetical protein